MVPTERQRALQQTTDQTSEEQQVDNDETNAAVPIPLRLSKAINNQIGSESANHRSRQLRASASTIDKFCDVLLYYDDQLQPNLKRRILN